MARTARYSWLRVGAISASTTGTNTLRFAPHNLEIETVELVSSSAVISYSNASVGTATLSTTLGDAGVAMCSTSGAIIGPCSLDAVVSALEASGTAQQAIYAKYNTASEPNAGRVRQAVEAAVMVSLAVVKAPATTFPPSESAVCATWVAGSGI